MRQNRQFEQEIHDREHEAWPKAQEYMPQFIEAFSSIDAVLNTVEITARDITGLRKSIMDEIGGALDEVHHTEFDYLEASHAMENAIARLRCVKTQMNDYINRLQGNLEAQQAEQQTREEWEAQFADPGDWEDSTAAQTQNE